MLFVLGHLITSPGDWFPFVALSSRTYEAQGWLTVRDMVFSLFALPITFASSAYYNLEFTPPWVQAIGAINPLTYSADLMRFSFIPNCTPMPWGQLTGLLVWSAITSFAAIRALRRLAKP